jgi:predicted nucleic acid-binding Zn ribbon protein
MSWRPFSPSASEREPRPVRESLERVTARLGMAPPDVLGHVFTRWEELVGADVAAHATPLTLRDATLTISVDHPAWATSLRILSADLIRRITEGVGPAAVVEIVVTVAGSRPRNPRKTSG